MSNFDGVKNKTWIVNLEAVYPEPEDYNVVIPEEALEELGWVEGDQLDIKILSNNTVSITKSVDN